MAPRKPSARAPSAAGCARLASAKKQLFANHSESPSSGSLYKSIGDVDDSTPQHTKSFVPVVADTGDHADTIRVYTGDHTDTNDSFLADFVPTADLARGVASLLVGATKAVCNGAAAPTPRSPAPSMFPERRGFPAYRTTPDGLAG